ncbi:MAG: hypothetical protein HRU19_27505 [Pseudobacteriovorax sp.]|nr:hypothetical protein [Pseudobacteriovorax sp.]
MDAIRFLIEEWLRGEDRSIAVLSRLAKVAESTIRRFLSRETDLSERSATRLLSIVTVKRSELITHFKKAFPNAAIFDNDFVDECEVTDDTFLSLFLKNETFFEILCCTMSDQGFSRAKIIERNGNRANSIIDKLISKGLVDQIGDTLKAKCYYIHDIEDVIKASILNANLQNAYPDYSKRAYMTTFSVSDEGLKKITDALDNFMAACNEVATHKDSSASDTTHNILTINLSTIDRD